MYLSLNATDSVWWLILSRATMISLHEASGVEFSQYCSKSILHRCIPSCGDDFWISCSLLGWTLKATPREYQSFMFFNSVVNWKMVGAWTSVYNKSLWKHRYGGRFKVRPSTHSDNTIQWVYSCTLLNSFRIKKTRNICCIHEERKY